MSPWYVPIVSMGQQRGDDPICVTCADVAEIMTIEAMGVEGEAYARSGFGVRQIDISLVADVVVGQQVLVHGGVALGLLSPKDPTRFMMEEQR